MVICGSSQLTIHPVQTSYSCVHTIYWPRELHPVEVMVQPVYCLANWQLLIRSPFLPASPLPGVPMMLLGYIDPMVRPRVPIGDIAPNYSGWVPCVLCVRRVLL